jgi:hypothetical protein
MERVVIYLRACLAVEKVQGYTAQLQCKVVRVTLELCRGDAIEISTTNTAGSISISAEPTTRESSIKSCMELMPVDDLMYS